MRNFITRTCAALSVAFLVACGGGGPMGKALDHRKAMISIIEANKTDANKAADALEKYLKDNEKALVDLTKEMEAFEKEMGGDEQKMMEAAMSHASDIADLMQREQTLRKEAEEVWRNERVREAMGKARFM